MSLREINLIFHFFGFGLLVTLLVAGSILELHQRKAEDIQAKAVILRVGRSLGLLSPFVILLMLLTGIVNMYALGIGLLDFGWLTAKVIFFAMAATNGMIFGVRSRKRGMLVGQMVKGEAPPDAESRLKEFDRYSRMFLITNSILLLLIVALSVYGRLGGQ